MHVFIWDPWHVCRWFLTGFGTAGFYEGHSIPPVYSKPGRLITGSPHHSASVPRQLSVGFKQEAPALVNRDCPGRQTMISQLYSFLFRAQGAGEFSRTPPPHALSSFPMCHLGTGEMVFQKNIIPIKHKTVLLENKDLHCSGF